MKKHFFLSVTCLFLALGATVFPAREAAAQEVGSLYYYPITQEEYHANYVHWKRFLEYHLHREQCQGYVDPPPGFVMKGCQVYRIEARADVPMVREIAPLPVIASYNIYFDFNRADIRPGEVPTLDRVSSEIQKYNPAQVTVSGHADTSGPAAYNQQLSDRRAQAVAGTLTDRGIENHVIDKEAYGETALAVETGDGVQLEKNRRVVIDFRR